MPGLGGFVLGRDALGPIYLFPTRYGTGKYMIDFLLPEEPGYRESDFINQFFMALGVESDFLSRLILLPPDDIVAKALHDSNDIPTPLEGFLSAAFVRLASGTRINYWEQLFGIPVDTSLPDSTRKATVLNQMKNRGQSPTVQYINNIVQRHVTQSVVQDQFSDPTLANYTFRVRIIQPRGLPPAMSLIQADLNTLAPQHLAYTITYAETDWAALANRDWAAVGTNSWASMTF